MAASVCSVLPSIFIFVCISSQFICSFVDAISNDTVESKDRTCRSTSYTYQSALKSLIPKGYSKHKSPHQDNGPTMVNISMKIMDIDDINEERMDFRLHTYIEESWSDPRLQPLVSDSVTLSTEMADQLWQPDVVFTNTKWSAIFEQSVRSTFIKIDPNGVVHRLTRYLFQVRCVMTFHHYPMDTQHCYFKISLMSSPNTMVDLRWNDGGIRFSDRIEPLQFRVRAPKPYRYFESYLGDSYTHLLANFTFERRLTASIVNTYIPSGLVVVLSWISFWLDVKAVQGRITLGVMVVLTLTTQVVQSRNTLPPVDYVIAVDVWLFACLATVFFSLLEYAIAYQYVKSLQGPQTLDESTHLNDEAGITIKLKNIPKTDKAAATPLLSGETEPPPQRPTPTPCCKAMEEFVRTYLGYLDASSSNYFDTISRVLFPLMFTLFVIFYWIHYTNI